MRNKYAAVFAMVAFWVLLIPIGATCPDEPGTAQAGRIIESCAMDVPGDRSTYSSIRKYFSETFQLTLDNIYWGEFHSHTEYSLDAAKCGALSPGKAYEYARSKAKLDFVALTDHAEMQNQKAVPRRDENTWQSVMRIGRQHNDENQFIVFPGWEYTNTHGLQNSGCGSTVGYGHKTVIFKEFYNKLPEDEYGACHMPPAYLAEDAAALWRTLQKFRPRRTDEATAFTIVHTPAHVGDGEGDPQDHRMDWDVMDRDFVRHVEIYSKWGGSEGPPPAGLACPDEEPPFEYTSSPDGDPLSVRSILYTKWVRDGNPDFELGFVGGTDNHVGKPGNPGTDQCGFEFRGGITGIAAASLTRDRLWTSLWKRHTLAASAGVRIPVLFAAETGGVHFLMGDSGVHNGIVILRALAAEEVTRLEVIVDGCVVTDATVNGYVLEYTLNIEPGWHFMYIRATLQEKPDTILKAWTSPVYLKSAAR
jgi:hypothetical protein